jgi:hypothetical protein
MPHIYIYIYSGPATSFDLQFEGEPDRTCRGCSSTRPCHSHRSTNTSTSQPTTGAPASTEHTFFFILLQTQWINGTIATHHHRLRPPDGPPPPPWPWLSAATSPLRKEPCALRPSPRQHQLSPPYGWIWTRAIALVSLG